MRRRGQPRAAYVTAGLLCVVNPLTWEALRLGQPEELLGGALCVGAVLAARRGRTIGATVLLGLALVLATNWWAVLDPVIVLAAIPLTALWWCSPRRTPDDVLGLLALLFLMRGLLDPVNEAYDFVPFLLALIAWEGLTRRGLPFASLLSSAAILEPAVDSPGRSVARGAALRAVPQASALARLALRRAARPRLVAAGQPVAGRPRP